MATVKINNEDKYVFRRYLSDNPHNYEDVEMDGRTVAALAQSYLSVKNKDTRYVKFTDGAIISNDEFEHILTKDKKEPLTLVPIPPLKRAWEQFLKKDSQYAPAVEFYDFLIQYSEPPKPDHIHTIEFSEYTASLIESDLKEHGEAGVLLDFRRKAAFHITHKAIESVEKMYKQPNYSIKRVTKDDWNRYELPPDFPKLPKHTNE